MSTPGIDASFKTHGEIVNDLDQGYFFPGLFQGFHIRVRLLARFFFEDRPHGFLANFRVEFSRIVGFRLIIPLAHWTFFRLLAVFFRPLPFRSSLFPVSLYRLMASLTVLVDIPRNSAISTYFLPRSCARIIASLKFFKLFILSL